MEKRLKLREALELAISYEQRLRALYLEAIPEITSEAGKMFFRAMAAEEQEHYEILVRMLKSHEVAGELPPHSLETSPFHLALTKASLRKVKKLTKTCENFADKGEVAFLKKAHAIERETSSFYEQLIDRVEPQFRDLFASFLRIEREHERFIDFQLNMIAITGSFYEGIVA